MNLQRRNAELRVRVLKLTRSRDLWREKAKRHRLRHEGLLGKRKQRSASSRTYTVEQWRQHALIVARIRAIPDRPSW